MAARIANAATRQSTVSPTAWSPIPRQVHRATGQERPCAGQTEREPTEPAGCRQQQTLHCEQAEQLDTGGAQGSPDGDLAPASQPPSDQEVGDVRACDEQQDSDRGHDE